MNKPPAAVERIFAACEAACSAIKSGDPLCSYASYAEWLMAQGDGKDKGALYLQQATVSLGLRLSKAGNRELMRTTVDLVLGAERSMADTAPDAVQPPRATQQGSPPASMPEPQPVAVPVDTPPAPVSVPVTEFSPAAPALPPPIPAIATVALETVEPFPALAAPPVAEPAEAQPPPASEFQSKAQQILRRIWNWIIIGEEYRAPGMSWEFAVATNWLLRMGIVIAVIGVGFFLKYSIEHGWIGPLARVTLSVLTGLAMLAGGVRLLGKPYHLLGQGLVGGGLAVLYFSMFAAFNFYHLVGMAAAFALMALVTVTAGLLAVRFNSLLIAILGIIGGYGTPLMLNTGVVNFPGLFGYLLLLGIGILGIAFRRQWPLLNYLGMVLTYFLACDTIVGHFTPADLPVVLVFLGAFFVLYTAVMILRNIVQREPITLLELLGSLANTLVFFGLGRHVIVAVYPEKFAALLALGLTAFYIALAGLLLVRRQNDRGLLSMFLAFAALFLALTPPLAFSRQWITASWALQGLIMLWLAGKLESRFLRLLACAAYALAASRLVLCDFYRQFAVALAADTTWPAYLKILGARVFELGVPLAALGGAWQLLRRPPAKSGLAIDRSCDFGPDAGQPLAATIAATVTVALLFIYAQLELQHTCGFCCPVLATPAMTIAWFGLGLFFLACARSRGALWPVVLFGVLGFLMLGKLLAVDLTDWHVSAELWAFGDGTAGLTLIRLLDFALCLGLFALAFKQFRREEFARPIGLGAGIAALALLFLYLTLELSTALAHFLPAARVGGITILWAAYALTLLLFGLQRNVRGLRYAGLAIFAVVVWKVFFSDLASLDAFYRIIAFIALGVILLGASLVYLRFRRRFQGVLPKDGQP